MTDAQRLPGLKGEYLWELDIAEWQLNALSAAIPADRYRWRPTEDARSVSEILVHIGGGNFLLLDYIGHRAPDDLYGMVRHDPPHRFWPLIRRNEELERTLTEKEMIVDLLARSFAAVRNSFRDAPDAEVARVGDFFLEQTTVRRVYLRMLAHAHEHMGQLIAYVRMMGMPAPWPDPRRNPPA